MKRERNPQEDEEETDDLDSHRGKPVKMEIDGEEESEGSGDDLRANRRILHHHQNERSECHISYVRVPENHRVSIPSGRSELDSSVLNNHWVLSVNPPRKASNLHKEFIQEPGNEGKGFQDLNENASDYNNNKSNSKDLQHYFLDEGHAVPKESKRLSIKSQPKHKNQYQQELIKVEDKQYEVDMSLECFRSACESFKEVYQNLFDNKINLKGPLHLEAPFRVSHLRLIESMYGEHGLEALEALLDKPIVALRTMLKHLKEKHEGLKRSHSELEKIWVKDYAHNHAKSLDFRS